MGMPLQIRTKRESAEQKGILAFTEEYKKIQGRSPLFRKIAGRDAYAPMVVAEGEKNEKFFREICGLVDEVGVG